VLNVDGKIAIRFRTTDGWFGVALTAFVTSAKLSYVEPGLVTTFDGSTIPIFFSPLSLAIPPWVDAMCTGYSFGYLWEETAPLKLRDTTLWRFTNQFKYKLEVLHVNSFFSVTKIKQTCADIRTSNIMSL